MEPASSNPPENPVSPQPQEVPPVVPETPVVPAGPVQPIPQPAPVSEVPPVPPAKSGSKALIIAAIAVLVIAVLAAAAYFLGFLSLGKQGSQTSTQVATPIATITPIPATPNLIPASPSASASASVQGSVAGKLCYPSEALPAGEIIAKDTTSGKSFTQTFAGTAAGGTPAYTFPLAPGTYHLKYQTSSTMAGYYTACAKDPTSTVCAQDSNHVNLDVVVAADKPATGVDLCDFYWNQTQKAALDSSF